MFSIEDSISTQLPFIKAQCGKFYYDPDKRDLLYSAVVERIWKNKDKFEGNEDNFRAWAFTIVRNIFKDQYRIDKKASFVDVSEFDKEDTGIPSFEDIELIEKCIRFIDKRFRKKPRYIQVFRYYFVAGNTYEDTADFIGIPIGSVRSIIHTIKKELLFLKPDYVN